MQTPKSILSNEPDYKQDAWKDYTIEELGSWVHLLLKRAQMRDNKEKAQKDITDAQAYLDMMQANLNAIKEGLK